MNIAVCTDELYPVNEFVVKEIERRGHKAICFGALKSGKEEPWVQAARDAGESIAKGECQEGIFFCWSGTGIAIAANKIPGIRAALCTDAQTASAARTWNHANVLVLSNRLVTNDLAKEILSAWFETLMDRRGEAAVEALALLEKTYRSRP